MSDKLQPDSSGPTLCSSADGRQVPVDALRSSAAYASLGDVICSELQTMPQVLRVKLQTLEAVAYANYLIDTGRWKLQPKVSDDL